MTRLSANLGFLWTELSLADAIRAAAKAGFDAVECHFPYEQDAQSIKAALSETGLPMLALNTIRGDLQTGEFGLCALPGRETAARAAIDQAIQYGSRINAGAVHCMAGRTTHADARKTYLEHLRYACDLAQDAGMDILIEPINHRDAPDYHLSTVEDAADVIAAVGAPNLRLMFDCYHTQIMQGDLLTRIEAHLPIIGHIQIAAVPSRAEPDEGEVAFSRLLPAITSMGYAGYFGAEYRPRSATADGLGWMDTFR